MEKDILMEKDELNKQKELKKQYKRGIIAGFVTGGGIFLALGILAVAFIASYFISKNNTGMQFSLGDDVVRKSNALIDYIDKNYLYEYNEEDMENAIYKAIMSSLGDPYSCYYTEDEFKSLMEETSGTYCGIGVVVSTDIDTGYIRVIQPYKNAPGAEAGIEAGDLITAVNDKDIRDIDIDLVVKDIKGEEGTSVKITVNRKGKVLDFDVKRAIVEIETVEYKMLDNNIGYIWITQFDGVTEAQVQNALDDLTSQGMTSLIVDVRDNPGGRLDVVCNILNKFIDKGNLIVYTKDVNGVRKDYKAQNEATIDIPCVVLTNGNSASASEIFAGALQDYELAHIIGTQSFGKGIVQSIIPMVDGTAFKITIEDYYTPLGNNIHGKGVTPDKVVEFDFDAFEKDGTDTQLNAAIEYLTK